MRYPFNAPFNLSEDNRPLPSTIIQERLGEGVHVYSMGEGTHMSPEKFQFYKMLYVKQGKLCITIKRENESPIVKEVQANACIVTPKHCVICVDALIDTVYLEVRLGQTLKNTIMPPGELLEIEKIGEYKPSTINVVDVIVSGFVHMKVICIDENAKADTITFETTTMLSVYQGEVTMIVDDVKYELCAYDSMRFKEGSTLRVVPKNGNVKLGVTNFFV